MLRKTFKYSRLILGTLLAVILAYIIFQVINAFGSTLKTVRASIETAGKSVSGTALLVRDEVLLPAINASTYSMQLEDGDKIAAGGCYAKVYATASDLAAYKENETYLAISSRLSSISNSLDDHYDIADINRSVTSLLASLPSEGCSAADASSGKAALSDLLCKRRYAMNAGADLDNTLNYYEMRTDNFEKNAFWGTSLCSDVSGFYSSYSDGYESSLSLDGASSLTTEYVKYCIENQTAFSPQLTSSPGKVVTDFKWEFLMPVSDEEASMLTKGKRYTVELEGRRITANLLDIRGEADGEKLLEFATDANISLFTSLRTSLATVIVEVYTGYRVPLDALRIIEGKTGVFCLQGYVARFVEVEVLWKADTYYIVKADFQSEDGLFTNDYIIINTKGLKDGKVVTNDPISY